MPFYIKSLQLIKIDCLLTDVQYTAKIQIKIISITTMSNNYGFLYHIDELSHDKGDIKTEEIPSNASARSPSIFAVIVTLGVFSRVTEYRRTSEFRQ